MTQTQRLARAAALASFLLFVGVALPTSAAPGRVSTELPVVSTSDSFASPTPEPPSPPTDPSPTSAQTGTPDPSVETPDPTETPPVETPTDDPEPSVTADDPTPATTAHRATETPSPTDPASATSSLSVTDHPAEEPTPETTAPPGDEAITPTPSPAPTLTLPPTPTPTPTPTSPAPVASSPAFAAGSVLINEVAWAGTEASTSDEWIELWNPGPDPIDLTGWTLSDGGDINISLSGEIAGHGFYLLERSDDQTVADIPADRLYTGSLNTSGERLELIDPSAAVIDTANAAGGAWPAGSTSPRRSMERHGLLDLPGAWRTFPGVGGNGVDADGNPIGGTPRRSNAPAVSPTATPTPTYEAPEATPYPAGAVLVSEVAWAGTEASANDEWIELWNPGPEAIDLTGWTLSDGGDINVSLSGEIAGHGFYLLERSDDQTVADIPADRLYTGALTNGGETLLLLDPSGETIDVVNPAGGDWPAGGTEPRASMERGSGGWSTFAGHYGRGRDAAGHPIGGTPRGPNSIWFPSPTPTWIPGRVVINEVLVRPRHDWEGAGGVTSADEFIELYNRGGAPVNLRGWTLDDYVVGGSRPYTLPPITLQPGEFAVFFRSRTRLALNDGGDSVRLSAPDGSPVDKILYLGPAAANLAFGRLPDGDDVFSYNLWPTPGRPNRLYAPPGPFPPGTIVISEVAWAGTSASSNDEWIELWNPGIDPVNLFGWTLTDHGDIEVHLVGLVPPAGVFLLERSSDYTVADVHADQIYSGSLANQGEALALLDPTGAVIDTANIAGGEWPAGGVSPPTSMQRLDLSDLPRSWVDSPSDAWAGRDAEGYPIRGSPGTQPTPALPPTGSSRGGGETLRTGAVDFSGQRGIDSCPCTDRQADARPEAQWPRKHPASGGSSPSSSLSAKRVLRSAE